ncbi:MAG: YlxM family DNA-binding protein [Bulleidia sp.]
MLDKIRMNTLLDFYGGLLTPKQQEICRFYYREDLSLTEIAELQQVSRAAVHDSIRRCEKELTHYEEVLKQASLSRKRKKLYDEIEHAQSQKEISDLLNLCRETEAEGGNYD